MTTIQLTPVDVSATDSEATVDGVCIQFSVVWDHADPSVGVPESCYPDFLGKPKLESRPSWDAAHPGIEPTEENMNAMIDAAMGAICEQACDYAMDNVREHDDPRCDDLEDYQW